MSLPNGRLALIIVVVDDVQTTDGTFLHVNGGNLMHPNGNLTYVTCSSQCNFGVAAGLSASLSIMPAQCGEGGSAEIYGEDDYTYEWSTDETGASINDLVPGTYSVTVSNSQGVSDYMSFDIEWVFTPVEVTTTNTEICFNFDNAPLTEAVQISMNGDTNHTPITTNTCYTVPAGNYDLSIWNVNNECPVNLGTVTVGSVCGSSARFANSKNSAIASKFAKFAADEFIKNFLFAEKTYIRYQSEIHRILSSKDAQYEQVNKDFETVKEMALSLLLESFVNKKPVTVNKNHLEVIEQFLISLGQATSKDKLIDEITKVRHRLHVMENKEVKDALIAFDRETFGEQTIGNTPLDPPNDVLNIQLLNTLGRESRMTYQLSKRGTISIELYDTYGQRIRTLQNMSVGIGQHQLTLTKEDLAVGVYFIHIKFIAEGGITSIQTLKLPVMK